MRFILLLLTLLAVGCGEVVEPAPQIPGTSGEPPDTGCIPACGGAACGDDGCGGVCGSCGEGLLCNAAGACVPPACVPDCADAVCGDDGCGGSCGSCDAERACEGGECICVPSCEGRSCGPDGCGGSCGDCPGAQICNTREGSCAASCAPDCSGRACGDDGCGGSCGGCEAGEVCSAAGACACAPSCEGRSCGDDGCGGTCGACAEGQSCDAVAGRCNVPAPTFSGDVAPIFLASCQSCHGGRNPSDGLDLSSAQAAWSGLVDVTSGCRGLALVVPGNPDASYLVLKLTGGNICGGRMPSGAFSPLDPGQMETIRAWIAAGAKND